MNLGVFFYSGNITLDFAYTNNMNLIKMQIPSLFVCLCAPFSHELVWRLSEFAFFVRLLRWAHFLFLGVIKTIVYEYAEKE